MPSRSKLPETLFDEHFQRIMREMDSFLNQSLPEIMRSMNSSFSNKGFFQQVKYLPSIHQYETDTALVIQVAYPGLKKENIDLQVLGNQLKIIVKDEQLVEKKNDRQQSYQRSHSLQKTEHLLHLPYPLSKRRMELSYHDNLLEIRHPHPPGYRSIYPPDL